MSARETYLRAEELAQRMPFMTLASIRALMRDGRLRAVQLCKNGALLVAESGIPRGIHLQMRRGGGK